MRHCSPLLINLLKLWYLARGVLSSCYIFWKDHSRNRIFPSKTGLMQSVLIYLLQNQKNCEFSHCEEYKYQRNQEIGPKKGQFISWRTLSLEENLNHEALSRRLLFLYKRLRVIFVDTFDARTISWIKMFVRVKNSVTTRATLPGIADKGMMKLTLDAITIVIAGR